MPLDPWGHEYRYREVPEDNTSRFFHRKDGAWGTKDDLSTLDPK